MEKFKDQRKTANGEERGFIDFKGYKNLWFNTGTLCNLECINCYIESSPTNDRLSYITNEDVIPYLEELKEMESVVETIGFTGGEPFLNPHILEVLETVCKFGFKALILTNAVNVIKRISDKLIKMNIAYPDQLRIRISLDHHSKKVHEKERGPKSFDKAIESIKWFNQNGFNLSLAGRSLTDETAEDAKVNFQQMLNDFNISLTLSDENLVIFPEMATNKEVPEITTQCFDILNVNPDHQMCASERMIIKKKGQNKPTVMPCTLLAYDPQFELGQSLRESQKRVYLNHKFCAEFCILGGASCSST
ncbi:MAG: radical SAM protein [Bacteriovoracaceae bacterium]|jgi:sulfatase maturation enzyme AslB (radical SAM superfamily)|nr:radical SAM protein [Bacteriovoracaceae bacterium]